MILIEEVKKKYSSEIALVLLCCRQYFETTDAATVQQFIDNNEMDWDKVLYLCQYHRIEPLIYKILSCTRIPEQIALRVKQKQLLLVQNSFIRALETERIIDLLEKNGISCTAYKGVAFSKQFYGDLVSRESSDIDLIILPADFSKVLELMRQDGYAFQSELEYDLYGNELFQRKKDLCFNKYKDGSRAFHIEFHWKISENTLQIKSEAHSLLFSQSVKIFLAKNDIKTLEKERHYMAVFIHHSNNDALSILRNIIDISQITKTGTLNTVYINQAIADFKLARALGASQHLSKVLLGISLPFVVESTVPVPLKIKKHFIEHLLSEKWVGDHFKVKLYSKSILYVKDNFKEKAYYLIACLKLRFTPSGKDLRIFRLPKSLHFLYFVLKPFRSLLSPANNLEEKKIVMRESER